MPWPQAHVLNKFRNCWLGLFSKTQTAFLGKGLGPEPYFPFLNVSKVWAPLLKKSGLRQIFKTAKNRFGHRARCFKTFKTKPNWNPTGTQLEPNWNEPNWSHMKKIGTKPESNWNQTGTKLEPKGNHIF